MKDGGKVNKKILPKESLLLWCCRTLEQPRRCLLVTRWKSDQPAYTARGVFALSPVCLPSTALGGSLRVH